MGKLYAIADLHLSYAANREALSKLHDGVYHDDGLILAGDLGEKLEHLHTAFEWATKHFKSVWWVPGNHELYTLPTTTTTTTNNNDPREVNDKESAKGLDKYEACVAVARSYGVHTPEDDFVVWQGGEFADGRDRALVCPIFTLYDYSFRPDHVSREQALDWALEEDVQATDEFLLHPDPFASRDEWCAALVDKFEAKLQKACDEGHGDGDRAGDDNIPLVLVNHWPLTENVIHIPRIPRFSLWCGTRKTADWHTRFRAKVVVSGHLHVRRTDWIDGVRFEECSLGYPRQWEPLANEVGRDINAFLREILPGRGSNPGDGKPIWRTYG